MTERDIPSQNPMELVIEEIARGERPIDQRIVRSLRELYTSGLFRTAILRGSDDTNELMQIQTLRLLARREKGIESFVLSFNTAPDEGQRLLHTMVDETRRLPTDPVLFRTVEKDALDNLSRKDVQTVAGMQISRSVRTGREIVQVHYPKTFGSHLLAYTPKPFADSFRVGLAMHFLQIVPFGKGEFQMEIPSH